MTPRKCHFRRSGTPNSHNYANCIGWSPLIGKRLEMRSRLLGIFTRLKYLQHKIFLRSLSDINLLVCLFSEYEGFLHMIRRARFWTDSTCSHRYSEMQECQIGQAYSKTGRLWQQWTFSQLLGQTSVNCVIKKKLSLCSKLLMINLDSRKYLQELFSSRNFQYSLRNSNGKVFSHKPMQYWFSWALRIPQL